jgi:hypothetical protein
MRKALVAFGMIILGCGTAAVASGGTARSGAMQLTIYNDGFASVKERRSLDLTKGQSEVRATGMTSLLETDSVVLRDLKDPGGLRILEQNYEANPLSQQYMLRKAEGQTITFDLGTNPQTGAPRLVQGKVIRAGGGGQYAQYGYPQPTGVGDGDPIVQIDGKIGFGLPGRPLFDALDSDGFVKPTLLWKLAADKGGSHDVEIDYLTGGFSWEASYNFVANKGDTFDVSGWITLDNRSGKDFENTDVKLVAGDVHRMPAGQRSYAKKGDGMYEMAAQAASPGKVTERSFDEYHLYTLPRPTSLRDRETKQVEFIQASQVPAKRIYVYDGATLDPSSYAYAQNGAYGTQSDPTVDTMLEVVNSEKHGLGMPLPKGHVKIYRQDIDGRNEFIGEDAIRHTPKDELIRLRLGHAFDLVGERKQTSYKQAQHAADESYEIKVRNHKKEAVEVRVVEHLWRSGQFEVTEKSREFRMLEARTIEFPVTVPADGEAVVTYTVHYQY